MTAPSTPMTAGEAYDALFGSAYDVAEPTDDIVAWYRELTSRIALVQDALTLAQTRRAMLVAHMHQTYGWTYQQITDELGDVNKSRVGVLVVKGRQHITPLPLPGHLKLRPSTPPSQAERKSS